jgi:hypothetical protein
VAVPLQLREQVAGGGGRRFGLGLWIDFGERELGADAIEPVLDGGIADAEEFLHLLDGAVAADEGGDDNLATYRKTAKNAAIAEISFARGSLRDSALSAVFLRTSKF